MFHVCCNGYLFFFFKQKTAYEMRISDWSSDVCSSDLPRLRGHRGARRLAAGKPARCAGQRLPLAARAAQPPQPREPQRSRDHHRGPVAAARPLGGARPPGGGHRLRSEEHTSELQSLMRISYAVFCLKKKNKTYHNTYMH